MNTYYAVCDANGPISVRIEAETMAEAKGHFRGGDHRGWIDEPRLDAENDLGIDGAGMDEGQFGEALEGEGCVYVDDLEPIHNHYSGATYHLAGGWSLWQAKPLLR